jgi:hypothetical protein
VGSIDLAWEGAMFVPIPGLGVLRRTEDGILLLEMDRRPGEASFGPQDVLPSGQKAALAVWLALLRERVCLDGKQIEEVAEFISDGV